MKVFTILLIVTIIGVTLAQPWNNKRRGGYGSSYRYGGSYRGSYRGNRYGSSYRYGNRHGGYRYNYYGYKKCPKLNDPENGDVKISGVIPGSKATYQCDKGFILVGSSSRRCQRNGKWSGEAPICKAIDCGPLPSIPNGAVSISPNSQLGGTATYVCISGHVLVGNRQRRCQASGSWSGNEPKCVRVDCGQLPDIPNGQVDISPDTKFGSYATYSCNLGHVLQGNQQRICQANGQWSGSTPKCVRVDCGPLPNIPNGEVNISPDTQFGSTAQYSCNSGFVLVGKAQRFCQANGQWSGQAPTCIRVDCGSLPDIPNGQVKFIPDTKFGSRAVYSCDSGHILVGNSKRTCQANGEWSGQEPVCERVDCGNLPDIPNGDVNITPDTQLGSAAIYTCDTGFELNGNKLRRCQADGTWSGSEPTCDPVDCGPLPAPVGGSVQFNPDTLLGSFAVFKCNIGFKLVGNRQRKCQANGQWSGSQPTCQKITCPRITPPIYGKIYTSGYYPGDHAIYSCTYGYSLVGKHRIICLPSGKWSGGEHSCKKDHYYGYDDYHGEDDHYKYGYGDKYHGDDDDDDDN